MASTESYLQYVLEQLSSVEGITHRAMMGEYLLYVRGKVVGGVYDDRLLVKPTPSAKALLSTAPLALPYEGGKPMLLVTEADDRETLARVFETVYGDLK